MVLTLATCGTKEIEMIAVSIQNHVLNVWNFSSDHLTRGPFTPISIVFNWLIYMICSFKWKSTDTVSFTRIAPKTLLGGWKSLTLVVPYISNLLFPVTLPLHLVTPTITWKKWNRTYQKCIIHDHDLSDFWLFNHFLSPLSNFVLYQSSSEIASSFDSSFKAFLYSLPSSSLSKLTFSRIFLLYWSRFICWPIKLHGEKVPTQIKSTQI